MTKGVAVARKHWVKTNMENHQLLALKMLFTEEQVLLHINRQCTSSGEGLIRTGIAFEILKQMFSNFPVELRFTKPLQQLTDNLNATAERKKY